MAKLARLTVDLVARTKQFSQKMKGAGGSVKRFATSVRFSTGSLLGAGGLIFALDKVARRQEAFSKAMRQSTAIMGNLSQAMRTDMAATAREVAAATQFSSREAAQAYFFLASAGLDAAQSIKALPLTAKFAQAGMFDMALATDLLTDAQSALGLSSKDASKNLGNMTRVADVLVKAGTLANASVQQFSEALTNKAGAALRIVGKDVEEGVAVLAAFADQGVKSSEAGTALGIVMRDLQSKALKHKAAFAQFGVAVFDAGEEMRNIADIVGDLERALDGMSDAQKKATLTALGFSDKSVSFLQALVGTSEKIRDYEAALRAAAGTTSEIANKQMTDLEKSVNRLDASFERFSRNVGPHMNRAKAAVLDFATDLATNAGGAFVNESRRSPESQAFWQSLSSKIDVANRSLLGPVGALLPSFPGAGRAIRFPNLKGLSEQDRLPFLRDALAKSPKLRDDVTKRGSLLAKSLGIEGTSAGKTADLRSDMQKRFDAIDEQVRKTQERDAPILRKRAREARIKNFEDAAEAARRDGQRLLEQQEKKQRFAQRVAALGSPAALQGGTSAALSQFLTNRQNMADPALAEAKKQTKLSEKELAALNRIDESLRDGDKLLAAEL